MKALTSREVEYNEPLILLQKYHQYLTNKPHPYTEILVHQRMVYLIATALQNHEPLPKGIELLSTITAFINKINIKVMSSSLQEISWEEKINLMSKCVDILFFKSIRNNIKPAEKLLQLRALTFNNLSCVYKENKQYEDALKCLQVSLQIEEALLQKNYEDTYKSIASTYINKCVILSSLSLHEQAIETIKTSLDNIEKYREKFGGQIQSKERHQISHMTMLAYFNIAVEYQHLEQQDFALKFYQMSHKLAIELQNISVKNQTQAALRKLRTKN